MKFSPSSSPSLVFSSELLNKKAPSNAKKKKTVKTRQKYQWIINKFTRQSSYKVLPNEIWNQLDNFDFLSSEFNVNDLILK